MRDRLTFLSHFVICLAVTAGLFFAWVENVPRTIWDADVSMMTSVVFLLFLVTAVHLGRQAWWADCPDGKSSADFGHLAERLCVMAGLAGTTIGLSLQAKALMSGSASFGALSTSLFTTACGVSAAALIAMMTFNLSGSEGAKARRHPEGRPTRALGASSLIRRYLPCLSTWTGRARFPRARARRRGCGPRRSVREIPKAGPTAPRSGSRWPTSSGGDRGRHRRRRSDQGQDRWRQAEGRIPHHRRLGRDRDDDVDLWVQNPSGKPVFYGSRDVGCAKLDTDNRGFMDGHVTLADGSRRTWTRTRKPSSCAASSRAPMTWR